MALARCLSINFSSISSNCFSALSCLSGLLGGCLKPRKPSDIASESPSQSILGDDGSGGVGNSTTSPISTLLEPRSFVMPIQDPENQDLGPIWINSVSVSVPQNGDLRNVPDEYILQNLTTYNAPVRINGGNDGQAIEIQSIFNNLVQKDDEKMSKLATSHMDEFSKLMLSGEANASYETKLPTPMRQVDELASNGDSIYEAMDPISTKIDGNNFPKDGVVLTMPTPIREEVLDKNSGDLPMHSPFPRVLQVNLVQQVFTPTYLPAGVSNENSDGSLSPIQPNFDMHNDPWGAEFEPPKEETYKDRIYSAFQGVDNNLHPQEKNEGGERSCYRRTPSDHIDLNPFSRVAEKKVVVVDIHPTHPRFMTDEEYEKWEEEQGQKTRIKSPPSNSFDEFFAEILISKNSKDFFRTLNEYVSSFTSGIGGIFPSPAPASPRVEPNNGNGKGK